MRLDEQIDDLQHKLVNTIEWYHAEFDIPFHAIIGVIEEVKKEYMEEHNLSFECEIFDDEDDEEEEGIFN